MTLQDRIFQWLDRHLKTQPNTAPPEFRPNLRVFAGSAAVSLIGSSPAVEIHYTTDGSPPSLSSPRYTAPFTVDQTTVVKAIAVAPGAKPSGAATATFTKGTPPPVLADGVLPRARAGQPYSARFAIEGTAPAIWNLGGQMALRTGWMKLDNNGVMSGTPPGPGVYVLQVQAAWALGQLADARTYVFVVTQ